MERKRAVDGERESQRTTEKAAGVANIGIRPTVGGARQPLLEVHLLDRGDNIYGAAIDVEFKHKLREERRFDSLQQLKAQIQVDIQAARDYFSHTFFERN